MASYMRAHNLLLEILSQNGYGLSVRRRVCIRAYRQSVSPLEPVTNVVQGVSFLGHSFFHATCLALLPRPVRVTSGTI